ncbi:MAG TPA: DUF202 domain-containing protein [Vicinamibacterales bacterium]|nr:DUF202 domain-containing protein [Vicinamibacterales bacterium]
MTAVAPRTLDTGTRLAVDRTRLAHERTLMAWVRTATSLISFGFTIYKFFGFEAGTALVQPDQWLSPRVFAMIMIGTGLLALTFSAVEHRQSMRSMEVEFGVKTRSVSLVVAAIVSLLGLLAFFATLFRA